MICDRPHNSHWRSALSDRSEHNTPRRRQILLTAGLSITLCLVGESLFSSTAAANPTAPSTPSQPLQSTPALPNLLGIPTQPVQPIQPPPSLQPLSPTANPAQSPSLQPLSPTPNPTALPPSALDDYVLGAGDQIRIDIFDVPEFSGGNGLYTVLSDGTLNLPWIGKVSIQNMTLEQAATALESRYAPYIRNPMITMTLLSPRPLRVGIIGQVNRPGVYTVNAAGGAPRHTVTLAIQAAGGITQLADLRKIEVRRPRGNGASEVIPANLWNFLTGGDLTQDVPLRDGDTLVIPEATALDPQEAPQLASANISPATISVNVVGEVMRPGAVTVPPNTSLNQALLAAGGFNNQRARQSSVELIRLNPNGTVSRRRVRINLSANINEESNPALRSSDIVVVGRSTLASTSDFLGTVLGPLNALTGIFRLLSGFGGLF